VIDFGQFYSEGPEACFHTRIIMNPRYGTALLETLQKSLSSMENLFNGTNEDIQPREKRCCGLL
jgi:hypothetical protein